MSLSKHNPGRRMPFTEGGSGQEDRRPLHSAKRHLTLLGGGGVLRPWRWVRHRGLRHHLLGGGGRFCWSVALTGLVVRPLLQHPVDPAKVAHGKARVEEVGSAALSLGSEDLFKSVAHALQVGLVPIQLNLVLLVGGLQNPIQLGNLGFEVHVLLVDLDILLLLLYHRPQFALEVQKHGLPFLGILLRPLHLLSWELQVGLLVGGLVHWVCKELWDSWIAQL